MFGDEEIFTEVENSMSERPERRGVRKLPEYLKLEGARKVHSLIDKVYKRKNLELAWKKVRANKGSGGIDEVTIQTFEQEAKLQLDRPSERYLRRKIE